VDKIARELTRERIRKHQTELTKLEKANPEINALIEEIEALSSGKQFIVRTADLYPFVDGNCWHNNGERPDCDRKAVVEMPNLDNKKSPIPLCEEHMDTGMVAALYTEHGTVLFTEEEARKYVSEHQPFFVRVTRPTLEAAFVFVKAASQQAANEQVRAMLHDCDITAWWDWEDIGTGDEEIELDEEFDGDMAKRV